MPFWRRKAKPPPARASPEEVRELWRATEALGPLRQGVISCLFGDNPRDPRNRFSLADGTIFEAFRLFVLRIEALGGISPEDRVGPSIIAAGHLLSGDLSGADTIIDLLPVRPYVIDHGAGRCLLLPAMALKGALPLPSEFGGSGGWLDGSSDQAMLRAWLERHRPRLRWMEAEGEYRIDG